MGLGRRIVVGRRDGSTRVTQFEYLAIAYSLIFSFAVVRLLAGLSHAAGSTRRSYIHLSHVAILLFAILLLFWSFWAFREVEWNLLRFTGLLAGPGLVYFLACSMIPDDPSAVDDWGSYYFRVRKRYFIGWCVWSILQTANLTFLVGLPMFHANRLVQVAMLVTGIAGSTTDKVRVHQAIAVGVWIAAIVAAFLNFSADALAP